MIRRTRIPTYIFLFFWTLGLVSPYSLLRAEDTHRILTSENIKSFILKTTEISLGKERSMSADDIQKYLERHIDDDVRFKSTIVYRVGDMPSEQTSIVLKKAEYMENIKKGAQTLQDYDSQVTVRDVKISSDGRRATVLTESRETGTMPIAPDDHTPPQYVPVQGTSTCNQVLTLDGEGIIRIYSAVCSTDIRFEG